MTEQTQISILLARAHRHIARQDTLLSSTLEAMKQSLSGDIVKAIFTRARAVLAGKSVVLLDDIVDSEQTRRRHEESRFDEGLRAYYGAKAIQELLQRQSSKYEATGIHPSPSRDAIDIANCFGLSVNDMLTMIQRLPNKSSWMNESVEDVKHAAFAEHEALARLADSNNAELDRIFL